MDTQVIKDYEGLISEGAEMPPIKVVSIQNQLYVVDGFHRVHAYRNQGRDRIEAEVIESTAQDALILAISANQAHGLRRSIQDRNKAVEMALEDIELARQSDRQLAKLCGVSQPLVSSVRARMDKPKSLSKFARKSQFKSKPYEVKDLSPPTALAEPDFDANAELVGLLEKENEELKDRLALGFTDGTDHEKNLAQQLIDDLREQLRVAEIELEAVKSSRDGYQRENSELKKQCTHNQWVIKKLNDQLGKRA
jgi:Mg2+ and Co2+ transporter CorA